MKRRRGSGPVSGPLEIRVAMGWQVVGVASGALGMSRMACDHNHITALVGKVLLVLVLAGLLLAVVRLVRLRTQGALLRLDDAGIAFPDGRTVTWGEIAEVRQTDKGGGLAFFPRGAVELPPYAPVLFRSSVAGVARRRTERFGTPLVLFPVVLDASQQEILAAVHRFGGGIPLTGADGKALTE